MSMVAYFLNKCPTKKLEKITQEATYPGLKPNMSHLRVCGSMTYRHVSYQLRKKLDEKGEQMIFVGYHSTGGYDLYV